MLRGAPPISILWPFRRKNIKSSQRDLEYMFSRILELEERKGIYLSTESLTKIIYYCPLCDTVLLYVLNEY